MEIQHITHPHLSKYSGYLEKKGSMKVMSTWRKYWFVLEGRLLLYYRSKDEYDCLSPCKGSINLGPRCHIKPGPPHSCSFQIETRSTCINLRAESRTEQENWMQAVLTALKQTSNIAVPLAYFRYCSNELQQTIQQKKRQLEDDDYKTPDDRKIAQTIPNAPHKSSKVVFSPKATSSFMDLNENSLRGSYRETTKDDPVKMGFLKRKTLKFFTLKIKKRGGVTDAGNLKRRPSCILRFLGRKRSKRVAGGSLQEKKDDGGGLNLDGSFLTDITFSANAEEPKPLVPPKQKPKSDEKTLDEILEDLDRQKSDENPSVVLRSEQPKVEIDKRHSENLNVLLEELCKVTSAPIMPPGVTSSLLAPVSLDEEWLKLLPVRRRRLSDPDYDVPRPHSSLNLQQNKESEENDNVMDATRFFGPVLSYTKLNKTCEGEESLPPDSLEILDTTISYTSHDYYKQSENFKKDMSKSVCLGSNCESCEEDSLTRFAREDFIDSLEPFGELKTAF